MYTYTDCNMCVYVYRLQHVCIHIQTATCVYTHTDCNMCVYVYRLQHVCIHIQTATCVYTHTDCNMCVYVYRLQHVCIRIQTATCVYTHTDCNMCVYTYRLQHVCIHIQTATCGVYTYTDCNMCVYMYNEMYNVRFGPSQLSCLGSWCRALCLECRVSWVRVPPEAAHFSLKKSDCLECVVLLCLVVCLTLLASFFLYLINIHNMCTCT